MEQKKKRRKGAKILRGFLLLLFLGIFVFSGWKVLTIYREYHTGSSTYDRLAENVVQHPEAPLPEPSAQPEEPRRLPLLEVDFEALAGVNADVVAWLSAENESLDYPVVQGEDNDYYLNHLFDGTQNKNGSVFMDWRNATDFSDQNTLIYGHNMNNGTMFACLLDYSSQEYYEENPRLILVTPEESYYLYAFSGYVTGPVSEVYQMQYASEEEYAAYLEEIRRNSDFVSDVEVSTQDRIVTLSTCSYVYQNARYVLHCKLVPGYREE